MHFVKPFEHARPWARQIARSIKPEATIHGMAVITMPQANSDMRDLTDETTAMLRGLAGDLSAKVEHLDLTGKELKAATEGDYEPVGADWIRTFRILVV